MSETEIGTETGLKHRRSAFKMYARKPIRGAGR